MKRCLALVVHHIGVIPKLADKAGNIKIIIVHSYMKRCFIVMVACTNFSFVVSYQRLNNADTPPSTGVMKDSPTILVPINH